uniref:Secreted protein n=1 Tax=Nelumbo nucifera TaxID=4432 RepID=A0A822Z3F8_NELNU|nr:TPA_asm: hypothetical protein HUJ06_013885 [Nelumbo nucifera]
MYRVLVCFFSLFGGFVGLVADDSLEILFVSFPCFSWRTERDSISPAKSPSLSRRLSRESDSTPGF